LQYKIQGLLSPQTNALDIVAIIVI